MANDRADSKTALRPCSTSQELSALAGRSLWTLPPSIREEASRIRDELRSRLRPADRKRVSDWLASLGTLCAGQMTAEDARVKVAAYVGMLDFPAECYTRDTLREAAELFRFWPSYAELSQFMRGHLYEIRSQLAEMERICGHVDRLPPPPPPPPYVPMPREQAEAEWRKLRETAGLQRAVKAIDTTPEPPLSTRVLSAAQIREDFARMFPEIHAERERAAQAAQMGESTEEVA